MKKVLVPGLIGVGLGLLTMGSVEAAPKPKPKPTPTPTPKVEAPAPAKTITITGVFTLIDFPYSYPDGTCGGAPSGGYKDIQAGMSVVVKDGNRNIIGMGRFGPGKRIDRFSCEFTYQITDLPETKFYIVAVGRRGEMTFSLEELRERGFKISSTLG